MHKLQITIRVSDFRPGQREKARVPEGTMTWQEARDNQRREHKEELEITFRKMCEI